MRYDSYITDTVIRNMHFVSALDGMLIAILALKKLYFSFKNYFFEDLKLVIFGDVNQSYNSDIVKI